MTGPLYPPSDRASDGLGADREPVLSPTPRTATTDPGLLPDVQTWMGDLVKAVRGYRVYADNNEMLHKFVERAYTGLEFLLSRDPEFTLSIREDRILYGGEEAYVNGDREDGLPFILYRNAFRRLVLVRGMPREELAELMRALSADYAAYDFAGEDLVTSLWRLQLPHVRYLTIDALSLTQRNEGDEAEKEEVERIQGDIENIVGAIYRTNAPDDDLVAGVSISLDDLEALREVRAEDPEDLELLDHATERAITDVPDGHLHRVQALLREENREVLSRRMLEILIQILFLETSAKHSAPTIELIQQLFDATVLARRYADATRLVRTLREHAESPVDIHQMHVARHLLALFATESRVLPVLSTLNEHQNISTTELFDFLRVLGPTISPTLLRALDSLTSPAHRRATCELIVELGVPSLGDLAEAAQGAKWFVVRDMLGLAQHFNIAEIGPLISMGLNHEHPKVRLLAVGMLRGYGRGAADQALAQSMLDDDLEVRLAAYRVAAARRSKEVLPALEGIIGAMDLPQRDPRELRLLLAAYAAIAGPGGIPLLERILNPGFLGSFTHTEAQVGAAFALASIGREAGPALQRGARTLNPRVREACRRAVGRSKPSSEDGLKGKAGISTDIIGGSAPATDPLVGAPPFRVDIPLPREERNVDIGPVLERERPSLPWHDASGGQTDELPMNLPPPPNRAHGGATAGEIPLDGRLNVLGPNSVDLVPGRLPPAPGELGPGLGSGPSSGLVDPVPISGQKSGTYGSQPLNEPRPIPRPEGEAVRDDASSIPTITPTSGSWSMPSETGDAPGVAMTAPSGSWSQPESPSGGWSQPEPPSGGWSQPESPPRDWPPPPSPSGSWPQRPPSPSSMAGSPSPPPPSSSGQWSSPPPPSSSSSGQWSSPPPPSSSDWSPPSSSGGWSPSPPPSSSPPSSPPPSSSPPSSSSGSGHAPLSPSGGWSPSPSEGWSPSPSGAWSPSPSPSEAWSPSGWPQPQPESPSASPLPSGGWRPPEAPLASPEGASRPPEAAPVPSSGEWRPPEASPSGAWRRPEPPPARPPLPPGAALGSSPSGPLPSGPLPSGSWSAPPSHPPMPRRTPPPPPPMSGHAFPPLPPQASPPSLGPATGSVPLDPYLSQSAPPRPEDPRVPAPPAPSQPRRVQSDSRSDPRSERRPVGSHTLPADPSGEPGRRPETEVEMAMDSSPPPRLPPPRPAAPEPQDTLSWNQDRPPPRMPPPRKGDRPNRAADLVDDLTLDDKKGR